MSLFLKPRPRFRRAVWRLVAACLLVAIVAPALAAAESKAAPQEIRVGISEDFRPYDFIDKDGQAAGFSVDLVKAVAKAMGLRVRFVPGKWDHIWSGLVAGEIDLLPTVTKTPSRVPLIDFSVAHTVTYDALFVREGQPLLPDLAAAAGKEIVVSLSDAAHHQLLERNFPGRIIAVSSVQEGLRLIAAGRHDAFLCSKLIGIMQLKACGIKGVAAGPPIPEYKREFHFAVTKGNTELAEKLNQGLGIIKASGEYDQIYQRWLGIHEDDLLRRWLPFFRWALVAIAVLVLLAAVLQWLVRRRTRQLVQANQKISAEVAERRKAELALQHLNTDLEQRVSDRTTELRASQEWLHVTLNSIGDAVLATDQQGQISFLNPVAASLTGWKPEEAIGQPADEVFRIIDEATRGKPMDVIGAALREKRVFELANHSALLAKDGREIPIEDSAAPILMVDGTVQGVVLVFHDVSEKRKAEKAARESSAMFRAIVENSHEALVFRDAANLSIFATGRMTLYSGYTENERIGRPLFDILLPEDEAEYRRQWAELIAEPGSYREVEYRIRHRDESTRWFRSAWKNLLQNPNVRAVVTSTRDITEQKRAQAEEASLTAQLVQAQKMESIGRLAGGVAHDFNNLLTVINGQCELALLRLRQADPIRSQLQVIWNAGERAARLTEQLLAFSRKQLLQPAPFDLNVLVRNTHSMLQRLVGEDVAVQLALDPQACVIHADRHQLEQVVLNLAVNARDAMPRGGRILIETAVVDRLPGDAVAELSDRESGSTRFVMLCVSDTGEGMDAVTKARIFEPFFTTKETGKGTGLGLSTVQGIVAQSGGLIELQSEPGEGATFRIYLPQVAGGEDATGTRAAVPEMSGTETIMAVEDQPEVLSLVVAALETYGYRVLPAPSAEQALALCKEYNGHIDLVLTDVVMPGMSGSGLVSKLRKIMPKTKFLFMSGYTDDTMVRYGVLDQGLAFLQKPFGPKELAAKVRAVLGPPAGA